MSKYNIKIGFEVGIGIIGAVENAIENFCFNNDYNLKIKRGRGIFFKPLFITIGVPEEADIEHVKIFMKALAEKGND